MNELKEAKLTSKDTEKVEPPPNMIEIVIEKEPNIIEKEPNYDNIPEEITQREIEIRQSSAREQKQVAYQELTFNIA